MELKYYKTLSEITGELSKETVTFSLKKKLSSTKLTDLQKIGILTELLNKIEAENDRLRNRHRAMLSARKINPGEGWYVTYLHETLFEIERTLEKTLAILSQYQEHYKKYSKIYSDYEVRRHNHNDILGDTNNVHRSDSGYPQAEEEKA